MTGWWRPARREALSQWWAADRGSVTTEAVLIAPVLVLLMVVTAVIVHRGVDARLRVDDAAHQAARAATLHRTLAAATTAATDTAQAALAVAGPACDDARTIVFGSLEPGATIAVTVSCTVDLDSVLGIPNRRLEATTREVVDLHRSAASGNRR